MDKISIIKTAAEYIRKEIDTDQIDLAIILGTGLGGFAKALDGKVFAYADIPEFPVVSVQGHEGRLIYSKVADKKILCFQGRIHYYEGFPIEKVVFPVRVMKELGVKTLLITNAAGGINGAFKPGDLMLITDHINLMGINPLIGPNVPEHGKRFPDMTQAYSPRLNQLLLQSSPVSLRQGVYAALSGPSYETPAEIRYLKSIGCDAVGMSTVPEAIVANHCGIETTGVSCITNYAAGISTHRLTHDEVIETGKRVENDLVSLILNFIALI